jgi:hypothetical protein
MIAGADRFAPAGGYPARPASAIRPPECQRWWRIREPFCGCRLLCSHEHSSDRCRKRVIAPPTESRRWPETPISVRHNPIGGFNSRRPLRSKRPASAGFVCADHFGRMRPVSAVLFAPTASHPRAGTRATGVGSVVCADRVGRCARRRQVCLRRQSARSISGRVRSELTRFRP